MTSSVRPFRAIAVVFGLLVLTSITTGQAPTSDVFLFSYFTGNGEDGLHFARSEDGARWTRVASGRAFLAPAVGTKLLRDPSVVRGPDGQFHMVWTTGWWDQGFGVAHSTDLRAWSTQSFVPVLEGTAGVQNVWAPEIHYDARAAEYLVVWSSTIDGRFPETAQGGDERQGGRLNHRLYATTTKDFKSWSPTRLFYDGGFSVIDGVIVQDGDRAVLVMRTRRGIPSRASISRWRRPRQWTGLLAPHRPHSHRRGSRVPLCCDSATCGGSTTTSTHGSATAPWTRATSGRSLQPPTSPSPKGCVTARRSQYLEPLPTRWIAEPFGGLILLAHMLEDFGVREARTAEFLDEGDGRCAGALVVSEVRTSRIDAVQAWAWEAARPSASVASSSCSS